MIIRKPITNERRKDLASGVNIIVYQIVKTPWDFLCPISEHGVIGKQVTDIPFTNKPPIYFMVREDNRYAYVTLAFYHRLDPAARHDHDFEGVLVKYSYKDRSVGFHMITVNHHQFIFNKFEQHSRRIITIEADGHGIEPVCKYNERFPFIHYNKFDYIDMDTIDMDSYRKMFNPSVKLPDQWFDRSLENYVNKCKPKIGGKCLSTTEGLWTERPDILFELAEMRGKFDDTLHSN